MTETTQALSQKIFKLRQVLKSKQWTKDGTNSFQEYKYISGDQYKRNLNEALLEVGLDFMFEVNESKVYTISEIGGKQNMTEIIGQCELIDPETGLSRIYNVIGQGADAGDKGIYKAQTGALKYFISTNFLVGESDDAEADTQEEKVVKPHYVAPSKRAEIKEEIMSTVELATAESKALIKDYVNQLKGNPEAKELITKIKKTPIKELTQNQATEFIIELEEFI